VIITVVGHLCLDVIQHPGGEETQSYGGIFFSIATLANLMGPGDVIRPVLGVGKNEHEEFCTRLERYPNVECSGIYRFPGPTNEVRLTYADAHERIECSRNISDPIPWKRIRSAADGSDMVLVNMISGNDITLETMDELRMSTRDDRVPVYLDAHSLTLGINPDFTRFHRPVERWRRWLFMLHGVHVNETEAAVIAAEGLDEPSLAKHVLALNTTTLHVTRGERGCTAFVDEHKHIKRLDIPGIEPEKSVDPTGCGDVFVAAYCASYMKSHDSLAAAQFANSVAGAKARRAGSTAIDELSAFRLTPEKAS
jgi:sugar/nucleoside kinase (ribokinase family)